MTVPIRVVVAQELSRRPSIFLAAWWVGMLIPYNPVGHLLQMAGFAVAAVLVVGVTLRHPDLVVARLRVHRVLLSWVALLLAWLTVSIIWSGVPSASVNDLVLWYMCGLIYLSTVILAADRTDLVLLVIAWAVGAVLLALTGFSDLLRPVDSHDPLTSSVGRMAGAAGDPNLLGAGCLAGIWLLIGLSGWLGRFWRRPVRTVVLAPAIALLLLGVFMSGSRGTLVALAASVLAAPVVFREQLRPGRVLAGAGLLALGFGMALATGRVRLTNFADGGSGRSDLWKVAIQMTLDHPVLGLGVGSYGPSSKDYLLEVGHLTDSHGITAGLMAHNTFLQAAAETGLVGLTLMLVFLGLTATSLVRTARLQRSVGADDQALLTQGILLALIALAVCACFISMGREYRTWALVALAPLATSAVLGRMPLPLVRNRKDDS